MCFNWKNIDKAKTSNDLTFDEIKKVFSQFSSIQQLTISGGEAFLRQDLPEILEFIAHNNDVQMITIPTNGTLPDQIVAKTKDILKKINHQTHLRIGLSVVGTEELHDEIVQVKGAFKNIEKTYHGLKDIKSAFKNFNIDISICCSSFNKKNMEQIIQYCRDNFLDSSILLTLARGDTREEGAKNVTIKEYQEILNFLYQSQINKKMNKPFSKLITVLEKIINRQVIDVMNTNRMPSKCYCYKKMIVIQSNGDVFPCEYLNKKLGNLRNNNFKELMNKNKKIAKYINDGKCFCTWECALMNNIVCNPKTYFKVLKEYIKY
jgi:MoaA/NifB/PqqE/SkfB family radical SAM enzyme